MMNGAEDDLFLMANLRPAETGLPMVVWVSEQGYAQHDVRVKVSTKRGPQISSTTPMATFGVRPSPSLIAGYISPIDARAVERWIALNEDAIVDYWTSAISTAEMLQRIQPISPPILP
jgi:hypothetical protein